MALLFYSWDWSWNTVWVGSKNRTIFGIYFQCSYSYFEIKLLNLIIEDLYVNIKILKFLIKKKFESLAKIVKNFDKIFSNFIEY